MLFGNSAYFRYRLYHAGFIIGIHDGNQYRFRSDRGFQRFGINQALLIYRQVGNACTALLQLLAGIQYCFVLGGTGNNMVALYCIQFKYTFQRQVTTFGRSGCKDHFLFRGADQPGYLFACLLHRFIGNPAIRMGFAGGIAKLLAEVGQHRRHHFRVTGRCRIIVQVDHGRRSVIEGGPPQDGPAQKTKLALMFYFRVRQCIACIDFRIYKNYLKYDRC